MPGIPITPSPIPPFETIRGPAWAFVGLSPDPTTGLITLTLDSASGWRTPDAAQSPNGVALGCTNAGWKVNSSFTQESEFCDESTVAEFTFLTEETMDMEAELRQPFNPEALELITSVIYETDAIADKFFFGGDPVVAPTAFLLLFKNPKDPDKEGYILFYKATNVNGFNITQITSKASGALAVKMAAQGDTSRPVGKQFGLIYLEK